MCDQASVSTLRRICSISSKCSWVQVSGGESWITGSPRSSARQISPASNSACDRKPRSRRSDSSSSNVSRVVLSLTTRETFDDDESERLLRGFLSHALFEAGLICRADDRGDPVIQLSPPLTCTQEHFDEIEQILRSVLTEAWSHI